MINKNKELEKWLIDYITNQIQSCKSENCPEFDVWAKNFQKEEAAFVVKMEFPNDWGYDNRDSIPKDEAKHYAELLIQRILNSWYL